MERIGCACFKKVRRGISIGLGFLWKVNAVLLYVGVLMKSRIMRSKRLGLNRCVSEGRANDLFQNGDRVLTTAELYFCKPRTYVAGGFCSDLSTSYSMAH